MRREMEIKNLWKAVGGVEYAIGATSDELILKVLQLGATDRDIVALLSLQSSFKEIESGYERMQIDPVYAAEAEREAAQFDHWVKEASIPRNKVTHALGRMLSRMLIFLRR